MNPHYQRGELLIQQGRNAEAEKELRQALLADPEDTASMALLAVSLSEQERHKEARSTARKLVGMQPDNAYAHYIQARVRHLAGDRHRALAAIKEALRLNPYDDDYFAEKGSIYLSLKEWRGALKAANDALEINPESSYAANIRGLALINLGRKDEARQTAARALEQDPENAFSHANKGWAELHGNNPKQAQKHFLEALRLQPDMEYARSGMLEALKARNPVYRVMLAYFLWMGRQSDRMQWVFIFVVIFAQRILRAVAQTSPSLAPFVGIGLILLWTMIYLSWVASPMFNLLLRFNRFGRHVLSREEKVASNWFGGVLFVALAALVARFAGWSPGLVLCAIAMGMSVCVAASFVVSGGARAILLGASAIILAVGVLGWLPMLAGGDANQGLLVFALLLFFGFQFLANYVVGKSIEES